MRISSLSLFHIWEPFLQVDCFLQSVFLALLQSLVTEADDATHFIHGQAMHVERVNQEQSSLTIPLCFAHFTLMLSL